MLEEMKGKSPSSTQGWMERILGNVRVSLSELEEAVVGRQLWCPWGHQMPEVTKWTTASLMKMNEYPDLTSTEGQMWVHRGHGVWSVCFCFYYNDLRLSNSKCSDMKYQTLRGETPPIYIFICTVFVSNYIMLLAARCKSRTVYTPIWPSQPQPEYSLYPLFFILLKWLLTKDQSMFIVNTKKVGLESMLKAWPCR